MEDSQSSDLFPDISSNMQNCSSIDIETYSALLSKIKEYANVDKKSLIKPEHLSVLLDECKSCIFQSLEIIVSSIENSDTLLDRLSGYIEAAVCTLQILSNCMKTIMESISITCGTTKNFSTSTGSIILSVFTHCKDSECIYGNNLFLVENQLKELFRNCHELQLIYLTVLDRHFLFDLTVEDDQIILEKKINLKIADVVHSLDVKTMAEQWKAYTMICEKYSRFLSDTNIFNKSSKLLAFTIKTNIKSALEANERDKIVLRSLKVASFSLKILVRICNVFKCSVENDYEDIVELLLNIYLCKSSYYELLSKTPEFSALMNTHLIAPSDNLIDALANEEKFLNTVLLKDVYALSDSQLLEHILLLTSTIKAVSEKDLYDIKDVIIESVFSVLPASHKWFNMGLKLKYTSKDGSTHNCGLYEYLLLNVATFTITFSPQQYNNLEKKLYEALLGTEYYCSLFASHLWVLLCRLNNKLQLDTLINLIKVYQKLESHTSFHTSPQRVHLSFTIENLFKSLTDKVQIYRHFNMKDLKNIGVWSVLKVRNLQDDIANKMNIVIIDNLLTSFNEVSGDSEDSMENLIKYLRLASTCSFVERDSRIEELLLRGWLKTCPVCHNNEQTCFSIDLWCFRYLEGLTSLTECYMEKFERRNGLVKILIIISKMLMLKNNETVHLLFRFFCKLSSFLLEDNDFNIVSLLSDAIRNLMTDEDYQQYIFNVMVSDDEVNDLMTPILNDDSLKDIRNNFVDYKNKFNDIAEWQNSLAIVSKYRYKHKCRSEKIITTNKETKNDADLEDVQTVEGNFDLGDVESLFGESDEEEPVSKKAKLDSDVESIIVKLEADVDQLSQVKENILGVEFKVRVKHICDKLKSIIS